MLVVVKADAQAVSAVAADMVAAMVARRPGAVLGLAAGATPLGLYAQLVRRHAEEGLDFAGVSAFGLDEYLGPAADHPASCAFALRRHLIDRVNLAPARVRLFDGAMTGDPAEACAQHERAIAEAGGLDLQILGLGVNGHIGFNEPGSGFASRARPVALTEVTRATNRPHFPAGEEVPRTAVTIGVGTILGARRIMLLATGAAKAEMVAKAVEGPMTARVPASALQMHADAVVLLDEAAAQSLRFRADYDAEAALVLGTG